MKRKVFYLAALTAALLTSGPAWSTINMKFYFLEGQDTIKDFNYNSPEVNVYSKGVRLGNFYWDWESCIPASFDDALSGTTVSYKSSFGHVGKFTITDNGTVNLMLSTLKVSTTRSNGQPWTNRSITIEDEDGNRDNLYTDYLGRDSTYLVPGNSYNYWWQDKKFSFVMADGFVLNLTESGGSSTPTSTVRFSVKGRYDDFPYDNSSYYLYAYGDRDQYQYVGSYTTQIETGSYWIRNDLGIYTDKIEITKDTVIWLDYRKVTFSVKTGTTPNEDLEVSVSPKTDQNNYYSYYSDNESTNSKGDAVFYLLPGEYKYSVAGKKGDFTVAAQDKTIDVKTSKVVITLNGDDPAAIDNQSYSWKYGDDDNYSSQNVTPENGKIMLLTTPGDYKLVINDICQVDVTVAEGENAKTVDLYSLKFTTNVAASGNIYINNSFRMTYNKKYYFTAGDYNYGFYYYNSDVTDFTLNQNKEIPINYCTLTVTVSDNSGVVENENVSCGNSDGRTDANGKIVLLVPYGEYELSAPRSYVSKTVNLSTATANETLTIPGYVTFNVTHMGKPIQRGNIDIYEAQGNKYYNVDIRDGVAKARLDPTQKFEVQGYHGNTSISDGSTLQLGVLNVSSEGMGLAFPMENWEAVSSYFVLVGSTVRLTAIPVSGGSFKEWNINGNKFTDGMIDLTITTPQTTANAVFNGSASAHTQIRNTSVNTTFSYDEDYVYLPSNVQGKVNIYSSDGKQVKSIGVAGDKVGIYDLPQGTYVLTLTPVTGDTQVARFLKK